MAGGGGGGWGSEWRCEGCEGGSVRSEWGYEGGGRWEKGGGGLNAHIWVIWLCEKNFVGKLFLAEELLIMRN